MSNYTKSTDFTAKDSLPSGDSQKVIRGSEFDTEFSAIATAVNSKADKSGDTVVLTAGTVSAPSLTTVSDTNTGIYFPAADKVAIATGGTERVCVDSSGNLGIGTSTTTNGRLNVQAGTAATGNSAFFTNLDGTYNSYLQIQHSSAGVKLFNGNSFGAAANNLIFGNSGVSETMRLDDSGNLGIGTSSPDTKLTVTVADTAVSTRFKAVTGVVRFRPYVDTTLGAVIDSSNAAESAYLPFTLTGSPLRLFGGGGTGATIDSSGNLGLGVTPSAWVSGAKAFQAGGYASFGQGRAGTSDLVASWNAIVTSGTSSGTGYVYRNTGDVASSYEQNGQHRWYTAPSGTAGNAITFTQAMTLDASGQLSVGAVLAEDSTGVYLLPTGEMRVKDSTENGTSQISIYNTNTTNDSEQFFVAMNSADVDIGNRRTDGGALKLFTFNTERARITSSGDLLVGTTNSSGLFTAEVSGAGSAIGFFQNTAATPTARGLTVSFSNATGTNTSSADVFQVRTAGAERATIRGNGGFANYQANDANLSDERLKTDIQPAASYLDKICAIPVKTFLYKDQTDTERNLGVIAQDVDAVAPELVDRTGFGDPPEGESPYLAIYQTDLQYALMKCIQEQQTIIEDLRARVATLENN